MKRKQSYTFHKSAGLKNIHNLKIVSELIWICSVQILFQKTQLFFPLLFLNFLSIFISGSNKPVMKENILHSISLCACIDAYVDRES